MTYSRKNLTTGTADVLPALIQFMYENEIKYITVKFSGSHDSGRFDDVVGYTLDNDVLSQQSLRKIVLPGYKPPRSEAYGVWGSGKFWPRDFKAEPITLGELSEIAADSELEAAAAGWDINAGSSGEVRINVILAATGKPAEVSAANVDIDIGYNYEDDDYDYDDEEYNDE